MAKLPSDEWARRQCAKKLARLILELYLDVARRKQLYALMSGSAPQIQRMVRGFLAQAGTRKMRYLRASLRSWVKPQFAIDFLQNTLNSKLFYWKSATAAALAEVEKPSSRKVRASYVRQFLPEEKKLQFEVDYRSFDVALELWYKSIGIPLSKSEKSSIKRMFKNPMNGNITVTPLDDFIAVHKLPCRKHGRTVCCDCTVRMACQLRGCNCKSYESKALAESEDTVMNRKKMMNGGNAFSICKSCDHPGATRFT
jgi:hypothetical protein